MLKYINTLLLHTYDVNKEMYYLRNTFLYLLKA